MSWKQTTLNLNWPYDSNNNNVNNKHSAVDTWLLMKIDYFGSRQWEGAQGYMLWNLVQIAYNASGELIPIDLFS